MISKFNNFIAKMSSRKHINSSQTPTQIGRKLIFFDYSANSNKRHYWDNPYKNLGFYTSDQAELISKRIKTESISRTHETNTYEQVGNIVINASNPEEIHCCTCHNNPRRYVLGAERCNFCRLNYQRNHSSLKIGEEYIQMDKFQSNRQLSKQMKDRDIQVNLPKLHKHEAKSKCNACVEGNKRRLIIAKSAKKTAPESVDNLKKYINPTDRHYQKRPFAF